MKDTAWNKGRRSARTQRSHSSSKDREKNILYMAGQSRFAIFSLGYQTARGDWRGVKTNVIEQYERVEKGKEKKNKTREAEQGQKAVS